MFADEIQRIDSIVNDISKIRKNYETKLSIAKENNIALKQEVQNYKLTIKKLENQIKKLSTTVKTKDNQTIKPVVNTVCEDENPFPKLKMKDEKIEFFEPSAFRLKNDAKIYNSVDAVETIATWEEGTSFTSNEGTDDLIKITGYFVNKVWTKAEQEMWIHYSDTIKRVRDK